MIGTILEIILIMMAQLQNFSYETKEKNRNRN